jgi:hypothetical protein
VELDDVAESFGVVAAPEAEPLGADPVLVRARRASLYLLRSTSLSPAAKRNGSPLAVNLDLLPAAFGRISRAPIERGVFFSPRSDLPRGRHALDRDTVREAQCERVMTAFTELVADRGLAAVSVTDVVAHAGVSRSAFYACFDDLAGCADAAYERSSPSC